MSKKDSVNEEPKKKRRPRDLMDSLIIAFVIAMIIRTFLVSTYKIPSGSMLETLQLGDFLIGNKLAYIVGKPKFGDVAIFEYPLDPKMNFIKRVIGEPGDEIEIIDKVVYRNGKILDEPYKRIIDSSRNFKADYVSKFKVPEGHYLMLGDNRDQSADSRFWGFVPEDAFRAKAWIIYFSKDPNKMFFSGIRWNRILDIVK